MGDIVQTRIALLGRHHTHLNLPKHSMISYGGAVVSLSLQTTLTNALTYRWQQLRQHQGGEVFI